jgi:ribosomal protein L16 Arg81 hydroxylase
MSELARLIGPVSVEEFMESHWERKPLVVHRKDPGRYADLLTLDDMDRVLSLAGVSLHDVRVVVDGKETPVSELGRGRGRSGGINSLETLYERYRSGSTVVVNSLQNRWEPLQRLACTVGEELSARLQMNIYLTPPGSRGFKPHYDTHDVFVAQAYGSKVWQLAGAPYELPLASRPHDKAQAAPELVQEFELCAGDLLYLPRGTIHSATANETASVHITIGVHPVLWSQVIEEAVARAFAEDVRFRTALPAGFTLGDKGRQQVEDHFATLLDALREQMSPSVMTTKAVERATSISEPLLRHHLVDLEALPRLEMDTPLRRRSGLRWTLNVLDSVVALHFHNKTVRFPVAVADEVRYVIEHSATTAGSIPGDLDEPGRRTLVHTLVREGFLTLAPAPQEQRR